MAIEFGREKRYDAFDLWAGDTANAETRYAFYAGWDAAMADRGRSAVRALLDDIESLLDDLNDGAPDNPIGRRAGNILEILQAAKRIQPDERSE